MIAPWTFYNNILQEQKLDETLSQELSRNSSSKANINLNQSLLNHNIQKRKKSTKNEVKQKLQINAQKSTHCRDALSKGQQTQICLQNQISDQTINQQKRKIYKQINEAILLKTIKEHLKIEKYGQTNNHNQKLQKDISELQNPQEKGAQNNKFKRKLPNIHINYYEQQNSYFCSPSVYKFSNSNLKILRPELEEGGFSPKNSYSLSILQQSQLETMKQLKSIEKRNQLAVKIKKYQNAKKQISDKNKLIDLLSLKKVNNHEKKSLKKYGDQKLNKNLKEKKYKKSQKQELSEQFNDIAIRKKQLDDSKTNKQIKLIQQKWRVNNSLKRSISKENLQKTPVKQQKIPVQQSYSKFNNQYIEILQKTHKNIQQKKKLSIRPYHL